MLRRAPAEVTRMTTVPLLADTRSEFDSLAGIYVAVAAAVALGVFAAIAYMLIRYRARSEGPGADPSEREGGGRVEVLYALGLAAIAAALIALAIRAENAVDPVSASPATTIEVVAFQWGWKFVYPDGGPTVVGYSQDPPSLMVPVGETVRFELRSRDVIHAFWIPSLRFKRDAFPDRTTEFDLTFDQLGLIHDAGKCAEFCGLEHSAMEFDIVGMTPEEYTRWLAEQGAGVSG